MSSLKLLLPQIGLGFSIESLRVISFAGYLLSCVLPHPFLVLPDRISSCKNNGFLVDLAKDICAVTYWQCS